MEQSTAGFPKVNRQMPLKLPAAGGDSRMQDFFTSYNIERKQKWQEQKNVFFTVILKMVKY